MKDKILQVLRTQKFAIILLLIVFMSSTSYAIYRYRLDGFGTITSSKWNVTLNQSGQNNNLSIIPDPNGTTASYTVNVRSDSEVDVVYSIVIDNLPSGTSVSLDDGNYVQESNNKVILSNVGSIPYSDSVRTRSHIIRFKAGSTAMVVSNQEVSINVVMKQTV